MFLTHLFADQQRGIGTTLFTTVTGRLAVVSFGTAARIAQGAIHLVREAGIKAGLFRPITLWPFPEKALRDLAATVKQILVFEMNFGQMVEDVKMVIGEKAAVHFHGRPGGVISTPHEIAHVITRLARGKG